MFEKSLHGLRGLAAFGVFVAHCAGGYALHLCRECEFESTLGIVNNIGAFGVEVFFLLSGFVIYAASLRSEPITFFVRRFWRLYPVLLLFTILFFIGNGVLDLEPEKNRLDYFFYNMTFTNMLFDTPALTPNAWTITYEVTFYLLTFVLVYFLLRVRNLPIVFVTSFLSIVFLLKYPISIYYLSGVIISILTIRYREYIRLTPKHLVWALESIGLLLIVYFASTETTYQWDLLASNLNFALLVIAVVMVVGCLLTGKSYLAKLLETKVALYLGTISYTLYLAHPYSYLVTRTVLVKLDKQFETSIFTSAWFFSISVLVSTLLLSAVVHLFVEAPIYRKMTGKNIIGGRIRDLKSTRYVALPNDPNPY